MAVIKIACTKCGQRVSGDESFYGTTVECPVCSSIIAFPEPEISGQPAPAATTAGTSSAAQEAPANTTAPAADSSTPTMGSHGGNDALVQTTSIPLMPENIVTQDAQRIGALNAAMATAPEEDPPSTLQSVLSMVFGILGLVFFPFFAAVICSPAAIITGHIALAKSKHSRTQPAPGRTMALIGVILGYAGLCVILALLATYSIWSKFIPQLSGE